MVTNEERREVAQKLRDSLTRCSRDDFGDEFEWFTETVCGPIDTLHQMELEDIIARLADLIEPEPERTCRNTSPMSYKFTCSECHSSYRFGSEHKVWYCPYCGAKLEGVGR